MKQRETGSGGQRTELQEVEGKVESKGQLWRERKEEGVHRDSSLWRSRFWLE